MEDSVLVDQIKHFLESIIICNLIHICRAFLQCSTRLVVGLLFVPIKCIFQDEETREGDQGESCSPAQRERCNDEGALSYDDVKMVMERLGMVGWKSSAEAGGEEGRCRECRLMEGARELLEEKTASLEELEEAFYVFDRNEDGFISPAELWCVMRRLGLTEEMTLEDCERMINVYDDDGDGKINFVEFRRLLENAI